MTVPAVAQLHMIPRRSRFDSFSGKSATRSFDSDASAASRRTPFGSPVRPARSGRTERHAPSSFINVSLVEPTDENVYSHITVFRTSKQMELHVRSPSVKMTRPPGYEAPRSVPVFDVHNKVQGTVLLDAVLCSRPGRLTIAMEGAFVYISPPPHSAEIPLGGSSSGIHRHIFLLTSMVLPVDKAVTPRRSSSRLREALAASVRPRRERRPSQTSLGGALRPFPFTFEVPPSTRPGEEMPATFRSVVDGLAGVRTRTFVERCEVVYKLIATWTSDDGNDRSSLEAPIVFEPEAEFESFDGRSLEPEAWIEIPLRSERPIPFKCALALSDARSFTRSSSIPYYVVFTTTPRSPSLAHDILVDSTISVSLLRQISIDMPPTSPSSLSASSIPSPISSSSSALSDEPSSFILTHKMKLMKRMVNSAPPILSRKQSRQAIAVQTENSPPEGVPEGYSETRTLYMDVYAGFPKRPRVRVDPGQHPSLTAHTQLPDGLYKAKLQLNKQMVPTIDWADLSVKYYLEVSVVFGQDETRARVPVVIV